jgi:hypothetical protein
VWTLPSGRTYREPPHVILDHPDPDPPPLRAAIRELQPEPPPAAASNPDPPELDIPPF